MNQSDTKTKASSERIAITLKTGSRTGVEQIADLAMN